MVKASMKWLLTLGLSSIVVSSLMQPLDYSLDPRNDQSAPPSPSALRSNRYTQMETDDRVVTANDFADLEGYQYRGTQGYLAYYDNDEDASFRIVDERSGYVWASSVNYDYFLEENSPLADAGDVGLNLYWQNKLRSPFFLTYYSGLNLREEHAFENIRSRLDVTRVQDDEGIGMDIDVSLFLSQIQFRFNVRLSSQGLRISLDHDSIIESDNFQLSSISFYPMMGATKRARTPGYVVIPDGVGALLRYTDDPTMGVYSKRFFGGDAGINVFSNEQPLFANMYGLVHGPRQHAMMAILEEGAGHAILTHYGSQVYLDFNFTYLTFNYRTTYIQYLNQAKTSSVSLLQTAMNPVDIELLYTFYHGLEADYVGLARAFGNHLFADKKIPSDLEEIPLHLDVLALESKPGLLTREKVKMTTIKGLSAILEDVNERITHHVYTAYLGWQSGGYSYTAPNYQTWDTALGSLASFQQLMTTLPETNQVLLAIDPYRGYREGGGYRQTDVMQTIGQEFIYQDAYYYLQTETGTRQWQKAVDITEKWGVSMLAMETVGRFASSHFGNQKYGKEAMIDHLHSQFERHPNTAVYQPFSYAWNAAALFDMPMYSSQQARMSDTIPLLPIMIAGHQHGFGRAGNFFSNTTNELLRMIDYGYYPAFFITEASAYQLLDTPSNHIFTSRYADWSEEIKRQYAFVSGALLAVYGQHIVARDVLDLGVVAVTYESGIRIVINYSGTPYQAEGITVEPMTYEVLYA